MKKLLTLTSAIGIVAILCGFTGCATTTANNSAISASQKEMMLAQSGFITKTVTTPKQKEQVEKLAVGVVSAVKYKGHLFYVFPTATKDHIYVGKQAQFDAYKSKLAAHAPAVQSSSTAASTSTNASNAYLSGETAGPNRIAVDYFDGFGPMQDNPAWQ